MEAKMVQLYNQRRSTVAEGVVSEFQDEIRNSYSTNDSNSEEGAKILKILETAAEPELIMAGMCDNTQAQTSDKKGEDVGTNQKTEGKEKKLLTYQRRSKGPLIVKHKLDLENNDPNPKLLQLLYEDNTFKEWELEGARAENEEREGAKNEERHLGQRDRETTETLEGWKQELSKVTWHSQDPQIKAMEGGDPSNTVWQGASNYLPRNGPDYVIKRPKHMEGGDEGMSGATLTPEQPQHPMCSSNRHSYKVLLTQLLSTLKVGPSATCQANTGASSLDPANERH